MRFRSHLMRFHRTIVSGTSFLSVCHPFDMSGSWCISGRVTVTN